MGLAKRVSKKGKVGWWGGEYVLMSKNNLYGSAAKRVVGSHQHKFEQLVLTLSS